MAASSWRRSADELLLTEGPQTRDVLIAHMMQLVPLGKALSMVKGRRRDEDGNLNPAYANRRGDDQEIGSRAAANASFYMAMRRTWIVGDDGLIRHRDWKPEPAGWTPPTVDELRSAAVGLGLSKWQWAAVVAAYVVESDTPGAHAKSSRRTDLTVSEFAALGFVGLQSKDTVRQYLRTWIEHSGGARPEPGHPVVIPAAPWPKAKPAQRKQTEVDRLRTSRDAKEIAALLIRIKGRALSAEVARELNAATQSKKPAAERHTESNVIELRPTGSN